MMTSQRFQQAIARLRLTPAEAATLLSVDPRTVRRWVQGSTEVPGPVELALLAWIRLDDFGHPWRPSGVEIGEENPRNIKEQIALYRNHAIELDKILCTVKSKGGPAAPWSTDLKKRQATLGPMVVYFYRLVNGSFSPSGYERMDIEPDFVRDRDLLQDAFACISDAVSRAISSSDPDWSD